MRLVAAAVLMIVATPVYAASFTASQQEGYLKQCTTRGGGSTKERKAYVARYCGCSLGVYAKHLPQNPEGNITHSLQAVADDAKVNSAIEKDLVKCDEDE